MRKFLGVVSGVLIISALTTGTHSESLTVTLEKGWNLKGTSCETDVSSFRQNGVKIVWTYRDGKWFAWSPDDGIRDIIEEGMDNIGILETLKPYEGFWVYTTQGLSVPICSNNQGNQEPVPDYPLKRALEGKYDSVLSELSNPDARKLDGQKIAYAIALLEKRVEVKVLDKMGLKVIPQDFAFLRIDDSNSEDWYNATEWVDAVNSLMGAIDDAIAELGTVSDNVKVKIPPFAVDGDEVYIDKPAVEFLKALLRIKKAGLRYLLSYDWNGVADLGAKDEEHFLPYLQALTISDKNAVESAKVEFDVALKELHKAAEDAVNLSDEEFEQSFIRWFFADDDDNLSKEDIRDFVTNTLEPLQTSLQDGSNNVGNPAGTYSETVNLKYLFDAPFDGVKLKTDVEAGKAIEVLVCTGGWEYCENGNCQRWCYDRDSEIWFTDDSYLYNYIKSVNPTAKLYERTIDGKVYYTVDDNDYWNWVAPEEEYPASNVVHGEAVD